MRREHKSVIYIVEARHFLNAPLIRNPWFVWSYAAHPEKKIIAEHVRTAKKHFPAFDFRIAKFSRGTPESESK